MFSVASSMLELDTGQITNIWQNESVTFVKLYPEGWMVYKYMYITIYFVDFIDSTNYFSPFIQFEILINILEM